MKQKQKILSLLKTAAGYTLDGIALYLLAGHEHTMRKALGDTRNFSYTSSFMEERQKRKRYYTCLLRLERDGFITKTHVGKSMQIKITHAGLEELQDHSNDTAYIHIDEYPKEKSEKRIVVAFDIPERFSKKRAWLRTTLRMLEFEPIQKSVWMGNTKLPEEFIQDLQDQKLFSYVHLFRIDKELNIE